jgi:hypothetical protein
VARLDTDYTASHLLRIPILSIRPDLFVEGLRMVLRSCNISQLLIAVTLSGLALPASAQEFRIHTTVADVSAGTKAKPFTSLTLFHAGKVYDYLESAEQTVIYEPTHGRFLVLSKRHDLATEITQDEIRRFLALATSKARELILEWQQQGPQHEPAIRALEFQLVPEFEVTDDEKAKKLTLVSPHLRYDVTYTPAPKPEMAARYLKSADWTAQLNSVLNPRALLPEARLRLNDELRKRKVIPRDVELTIFGDHPVHLKARHDWTWNLHPNDRTYIDKWESQLRQPGFRTIPFLEFQQQTLTASRRR